MRCFRNFVKDKRPEFIKAKTNKKKAANELLAAVSNDIALKKEEAKKEQLPNDPWADEETRKMFFLPEPRRDVWTVRLSVQVLKSFTKPVVLL